MGKVYQLDAMTERERRVHIFFTFQLTISLSWTAMKTLSIRHFVLMQAKISEDCFDFFSSFFRLHMPEETEAQCMTPHPGQGRSALHR